MPFPAWSAAAKKIPIKLPFANCTAVQSEQKQEDKEEEKAEEVPGDQEDEKNKRTTGKRKLAGASGKSSKKAAKQNCIDRLPADIRDLL